MVMTNEKIIEALNMLEMSSGMHMISDQLREAIIHALSPPKAAAKKAAPKPPSVKGKQPE